ncbi:hypothetical protein LXL04_037815 [Taraxacum kok-saghyz]
MPPKKRGRPSGTGGDPPPFDPEAMETMIQERITAALVAYELAHPTGGGGGGGGGGPCHTPKPRNRRKRLEYLGFNKLSDHGLFRDGGTQTRANHRTSHDPKDYLALEVSNRSVFISTERYHFLLTF